MADKFQSSYIEMDKLSLQGEPFIFMIDFLGERIRVIPNDEIQNAGVLIDFPNFQTKYEAISESSFKKFAIESYPEKVDVFKKGFDNVQKHLNLGNSYLANYTCKTLINMNYTLQEVFAASKAKYKVLLDEEYVCFSPETFVEIKENRISTYPMKGTIDASIENAEQILREDKKEKAEHYTVVDLLRNDLSMVADMVEVEEFQRIDFIKSNQKELLAMSSKITGNLKPEFIGKVGSVMEKLLPAGSILGAPKPKTMDIILESERYPRGWYTGIAGYFDGKDMDSCVLIRFIEKNDQGFFFRSGGGITHQSKLQDEFQEMKNKIYVPIY